MAITYFITLDDNKQEHCPCRPFFIKKSSLLLKSTFIEIIRLKQS